MISVVVAAYNEEKTLGLCLDSLLAQTAPRESYEIIVADDGSTDKTRQVAESRGVQLVTQPNHGAGAARNLGARCARGDIVLFIDADCVPDARCVEAMAAAFADPVLAGASGEKKTRQRNFWARLIQIEYDYKYDRLAAHPTIDFVDSSTAGYRRDIFLTNGGFDPTLKEAEDVDLSFRLAERGLRLVLAREAITYHTHPESPLVYLKRKFQYARGRATVYRRFPGKAASDQRTPQSQKLQVLIAFGLIPAAFAALIWNTWGWAVAVLALIFIVTTLRFSSYCWKYWRGGILLVPLIFLLSAFASGAGTAVGFLENPPSSIEFSR
jgi:cellulose synthase/poly-beta-1,6-N-acetylglucosamine synthase-like glycosyltransferase